jgi:hypothetical protein
VSPAGPPSRRGSWGRFAAGSAIGLVLGGLLTEYAGWRWCLYINVPIALLALLGTAVVPRDCPIRAGGRLDVPGALLSAAGFVAVVYAFNQAEPLGWGSPVVLALLAGGVLLLVAFAVAEAIGRACESSGFFTIVGHGVPQSLVDRMYRTTNEFFKLPDVEKDVVANRPGVSGFRRSGGTTAHSLDQKTPPDLCEAFAAHVTGELSEQERAKLGGYWVSWKLANIWPDVPADFKETWHEYMSVMAQLSGELMRLFALALELDEEFFDNKFDDHVSSLTANYYYPQLESPLPGQMRRGPHTDFGGLTVLYQEDDLGGLQVSCRSAWAMVTGVMCRPSRAASWSTSVT